MNGGLLVTLGQDSLAVLGKSATINKFNIKAWLGAQGKDSAV